MTFSRDVSLNKQEMNPMKKHIHKSQQVSSIVVEPNKKNYFN